MPLKTSVRMPALVSESEVAQNSSVVIVGYNCAVTGNHLFYSAIQRTQKALPAAGKFPHLFG